MVKTTLVSTDFEIGSQILAILDAANLKVSVAIWIYASEYQDWRLALSSCRLDEENGADRYGLVFNALIEAGLPYSRTPSLLIFRTSDPFIKSLRRLFGKTESVEGMRLGGTLIGDRFIEDAVAYRIK